jgi:hypothetical protein
MGITMIPVRATVVAGGISASTPFVQSFNVRKQRGQPSTFDASLKVPGSSAGGVGGGSRVTISAGAGGSSSLIFTGICKAARVSPCFDDPNYAMVSISGTDAMYKLEGQLYTRRCRGTKSTWVTITGVVRKGLKSGKFAYVNEPTLYMDYGETLYKSEATVFAGKSAIDKRDIGKVKGNDVSPPVVLTTQVIYEEAKG